jgi:hypothetical protein
MTLFASKAVKPRDGMAPWPMGSERDVALLLLELRCTYGVRYGPAVVRLGEWRFTKIDTSAEGTVTVRRTYRST